MGCFESEEGKTHFVGLIRHGERTDFVEGMEVKNPIDAELTP